MEYRKTNRYCALCGKAFADTKLRVTCSNTCQSILEDEDNKRLEETYEKYLLPKALEVMGFESLDEYAAEKESKRHGDIYFISDEAGKIKIGFSRDINKRMSAMQISTPHKLTLLGSIKGSTTDEKELHERFNYCRVRGEWFNPEPELVSYINNI